MKSVYTHTHSIRVDFSFGSPNNLFQDVYEYIGLGILCLSMDESKDTR